MLRVLILADLLNFSAAGDWSLVSVTAGRLQPGAEQRFFQRLLQLNLCFHSVTQSLPIRSAHPPRLCSRRLYAAMEAFHLLTRGGATFNKTKFEKDVQLFNVSSSRPEAFARLMYEQCLG